MRSPVKSGEKGRTLHQPRASFKDTAVTPSSNTIRGPKIGLLEIYDTGHAAETLEEGSNDP